LLVLVAAGVALALRGRPARLRAVVWATALAGCLVIPLVAPLLPSWSLPVPASIARFVTPNEPVPPTVVRMTEPQINTGHTAILAHETAAVEPIGISHRIDWTTVFLTAWAIGAALMLARLGIGLWRMTRAVRRAQPFKDRYWLAMLGAARDQTGCRRRVRLVTSSEVEIPATVGFFRPVVVLPLHAKQWVWDRRQAVMLHEMVHVARIDWPVRTVARLARAVYWFNPLMWWAVRRLDLEQELACDEEVLALGTRASSYACHLLGIARHAAPCPSPAIPALGMARRTHLEERIMSILNRTKHRRVGLAVLLPAAILMAAMVPALASVVPGDPPPRPADAELKQILTEMEEAEARIEPHLAKIEGIEIEMEPRLEMLENIEVSIDHSRLEEIEKQMEPFIERMEEIEIDMAPFHAQMEAMGEQLQNLEIHIEDGTLQDVQRQIHEQIEVHMELIEDIHVDMEPFLEQIEAIHVEMEDLHVEMANIHVDMEPFHEQMEQFHIDMEPFHEQMEQFHRELEPFHEEMELLGARLEEAIAAEVAAFLRDELGAVTSPEADFHDAAARIVDDASINVRDNVVRVDAPRGNTRDILNDLYGPQRIGMQKAFDEAVERAVDGLSDLRIQAD
jgi:beta-lactamase regulating signal transducer with metallopeptidase domain/archaellum component FlaC